jgi:hypothetical protein
MNPILLYPQTATEAKFYQRTAESRGTEIVSIPKNILEKIDDYFFGMYLHDIRLKDEKVSREKVMKTIDKLIAENE